MVKVSGLTIVHQGIDLTAFDIKIDGQLTRCYLNWRERQVVVHARSGRLTLSLDAYEKMTGDMCVFIEHAVNRRNER